VIDVYVKELENVWIGIAYAGEKIVATALNSDEEDTLKSLQRSLPPNVDHQIVEKGSEFAEETVSMLKDVYSGNQEVKEFALATEYVPEPAARVLKAAASIPVGYVTSYGRIAEVALVEPKFVGRIMASNPLYPLVPCHRVVGADFSLVGYGGRRSPRALNAKLARLSKECKGFKSKTETSVDGKKLEIFPVENVIEKAKRQDSSFLARQQHKLTSF